MIPLQIWASFRDAVDGSRNTMPAVGNFTVTEVEPAHLKALNSIILEFYDVGGEKVWNPKAFNQTISYMKELGMNYIFILYIAGRDPTTNQVYYQRFTDEQLEGVLTLCDQTGIRVGMGAYLWNPAYISMRNSDGLYYINQTRLNEEMTNLKNVMNDCFAEHGQHKSFDSWILDHETSLFDIAWGDSSLEMIRQTAYWQTGVENSHGKPVFGACICPENMNIPASSLPTPVQVQSQLQKLLRRTGIRGVIMVDHGALFETGIEYLDYCHKYTDVYFPVFKQACVDNGVVPIIQIETHKYANYWQTGSWDRTKTQFDHDFPICNWLNLYTLAHIRPDYRPEQTALYENVKNYLDALPNKTQIEADGFP